jgi:phospholipid transport system substrate-binding protein
MRASASDAEVVFAPRFAARAIQSSSDYRLEKDGAGWKIYDVNVLGVWLVENYRNSFAQEIGANGIEGLIAKLAERNKSAAAGTKS